jgi:hypothetical protein
MFLKGILAMFHFTALVTCLAIPLIIWRLIHA